MVYARLFVLTGLIGFTGCAKQYEVVTAPQQANLDSYVVVQYTNSGGMKIWDCRSEPDGRQWDPTCVRVRMNNAAREDAPE